jgi:hypothetical protein
VNGGVYSGDENCRQLLFTLDTHNARWQVNWTIHPSDHSQFISFQCGFNNWTDASFQLAGGQMHEFRLLTTSWLSTPQFKSSLNLINFEYKNNVRMRIFCFVVVLFLKLLVWDGTRVDYLSKHHVDRL